MDLVAAAARARHDLGRYVALQTRFVGTDGPLEDLRDALESDLLHTRRSPSGDLDVAGVWAMVRDDLAGADIAEVDALVSGLARRAASLATLDEPGLRETATLALACAEAVREVHRRAAEALPNGPI
jgi:hypothetical protein